MQQSSEQLQALKNNLQTIVKFEELFSSFDASNLTAYSQQFGKNETPGTFIHYINDKSGGMSAGQKIESAFANFTYDGERAELVEGIIEAVKGIVVQTKENAKHFTAINTENHASRAFSLVNLILTAARTTHPDRAALVARFNRLIALQKTALTKKERDLKTAAAANNFRLIAGKLKSRHLLDEVRQTAAENRRANASKRTNLYLGAAALATGGTGAIAFSTLMQFGPQFAMLASLNLPPVALAAVAVSGVAMVAAAAYVAYRTYKPAPVVIKDASEAKETLGPVAATNYSKFLPHVLATMGTGMVGFSALMQFSPKVALFMGLNLTPAALISVAAVGVLLLSASLYLACKAYAKSRVVATEVTASADAPVNTSYMQRLSQHSDCCLKLFKKPTTTSVATAQGNQVGGAPTSMVMDRV
jgi:hypothetical protein